MNKRFLNKEYIIKKKSTNQIAKEVGCADCTIWRSLKIHRIKIRTISESLKVLNNKYSKTLTKEFLMKEYIKNKKPGQQIAEQIGCSNTTIYKYLIKFNIKTRTTGEARKGKNNPRYNPELHKKHFCIDCGKETDKRGRSKRCYSCNSKNNWQNKEFREKTLKASFEGRKITPNKPEKVLIKLLNKALPKTYKFVGDGKLIVGGFVPDFANKANTKIIELFGCYWHNKKGAKEKDRKRINTFKRYNYKVLIIWEHELKDLDKIKSEILKFNKI